MPCPYGNLEYFTVAMVERLRFKNEKNFDSEIEFQILDKLFGYVDAYCSDPALFDPEFDIDEAELRLSAQEALNALENKFDKPYF